MPPTPSASPVPPAPSSSMEDGDMSGTPVETSGAGNADEYKLSATGKLFFASLISYLAGSKSVIKLKATPEQIKAISNVVTASKEFQEEVLKPTATVDSVISKMRKKNEMIKNFVEKTGRNWPL